MSDRFSTVDRAVRQAFGGDPAWRFFVPGRIEVFGKHTDYCGGRSLVAAVPRGFAVAARPAVDGCVTVLDGSTGRRFVYVFGQECPVTARWHGYVLAVVRRLAANFPGAELATSLAFTSDLAPAAGISSSSALVIAVAEALIARANIEQRDEWRDAVRTVEDRAAYFGCMENGSSFGRLQGDTGVGTHGGSEDHAAILASREGHLQQFSFAPLRLDRRIPVDNGWTFVIGSTGVRASKTGAARGDYNRLSRLAAEILEEWRAQHPGDPRTLGELARAGLLDPAALQPHLSSRCEHFVLEDARVVEASQAFADADVERIAALADASQRDAARLLANQVPETIDLVSAARDLGAAAASGFGAGWGGSVWALVRSADASDFLEAWIHAYRGRHPHRAAQGFVSPPSSGVVRL